MPALPTPPPAALAALRGRLRRGSVLVIVMITLVFATLAVVAFIEKASVDLLVDQRQVLDRRLRMEAYSALDVTLGLLTLFQEVGQGLRSPAEGWANPLEFAGYTPSEGREVTISFDDESGKISLPRSSPTVLFNLFRNWGVERPDAEAMADALTGWMKRNHVYTTTLLPNYENSALPFEAPGRSLRSYNELFTIEKVRDMLYDAEGRPNDLWKRFVDSVSLFDFQKPNINGAKPDTLAALGQFDETQQQNVGEYLRGEGQYMNQGPQFFGSANDAGRVTGPTGDLSGFASTISALRIFVTVREGTTSFRLSVVVAPPNGATTVQTTATSTRTETSTKAAQTTSQQQNRPNAAQAARTGNNSGQQTTAARNLKYPYTLLDIRENDEIPGAVPGVTL